MKKYSKDASENNKLILNFMNAHYYDTTDYSLSWDKLMLVIEKVKSLNYSNLGFTFSNLYSVDNAAWMFIGGTLDDYKSCVSNELNKSLLENNYDAVVEFIKYYNNFVIKCKINGKNISKKSQHIE